MVNEVLSCQHPSSCVYIAAHILPLVGFFYFFIFFILERWLLVTGCSRGPNEKLLCGSAVLRLWRQKLLVEQIHRGCCKWQSRRKLLQQWPEVEWGLWMWVWCKEWELVSSGYQQELDAKSHGCRSSERTESGPWHGQEGPTNHGSNFSISLWEDWRAASGQRERLCPWATGWVGPLFNTWCNQGSRAEADALLSCQTSWLFASIV